MWNQTLDPPEISFTSKELGIIVHAKVADPAHEYIGSFKLAQSGKDGKEAMTYRGTAPMHAMLIAARTGWNTDTIHDEANGFDQFLLEPPPDPNSKFWIESGNEYTATACSSNGRCSSGTFTLGEKLPPGAPAVAK